MTTPVPPRPADVDPFDLPEWVGECAVTWEPEPGVGIGGGHLVRGFLRAASGAPDAPGPSSGSLLSSGSLPCDLLAMDEAYPAPVADDDTRARGHQAWNHGQVLLVAYSDRLTLVVPGREFSADKVLEALRRFALAVGAEPGQYAALLRLGTGS